MSAHDMERAQHLRAAGVRLGRKGMSEAVIAAVAEFDGSYKGAMQLAGQLKAVTQAAKSDDYWSELVDRGFEAEFCRLCASGQVALMKQGEG